MEFIVMINRCIACISKLFFSFLHRNFNCETTAFPFLAVQTDCSAKHRHNITHYGKPKPETLLCGGI